MKTVTLDKMLLVIFHLQAVFERLMLADPGEYVFNTSNSATFPSSDSAAQSDIIRYLFGSFSRLNVEMNTCKVGRYLHF